MRAIPEHHQPHENALKRVLRLLSTKAKSWINTVYISRTGDKYHWAWCNNLWCSKIPISRSDAKSQGYTPCAVCRPNDILLLADMGLIVLNGGLFVLNRGRLLGGALVARLRRFRTANTRKA